MAKSPAAPPKQETAEILAAYIQKCKLFLADAGIHGLEETVLAAKCRTKKNGSALFQTALESLRKEGLIYKQRRKYYWCAALHCKIGTVVRLSRTFGFVRPDDAEETEDWFIPGKFLLGALPQDRVLIRSIPSRSGKPEGEVLDILEPAPARLIGVIIREDGHLVLLPDTMSKTPIRLLPNKDLSYQEQDKVLAEIVSRGTRHAEHKARVLYSFGSADSAAVCAKALLTLENIFPVFPAEAEAEAAALASAPIPVEAYRNRLDLRDTCIFTIDSAESKDLDDAVSIERTETGYRLGVHIADVSHYVKPHSALDKEALARGTSLYYADQVVPMLPKALSNGICSLNPQEDRLTFSALMELDEQGVLRSYTFRKTVIRSRVKGVYKEINALLDGTAEPALHEKYAEVMDMLPILNELCDKRLALRKQRGAPEIETPESKITLNAQGICVDVQPRTRGKSECIIEEMMLLANESAARVAKEHALPFVYRVHDAPSSEKIDALQEGLLRMGAEVPVMTTVQPRTLAEILEKANGTPAAPVIHGMVLRSMAKAAYEIEPVGHFGLALKDYAHFTSPIRRYPDLAIHRILSEWCSTGSAEAVQKRFTKFAAKAAEQSSQRELLTIRVSRDCEACYFAEYMRQHLGEEMTGLVTGVTDFGIYVMLPNTVEGMVSIRDMGEGKLWTNDHNIRLMQENGSDVYQLGDTVKVICTKTDLSSGNIDFQLVEESEGAASCPSC